MTYDAQQRQSQDREIQKPVSLQDGAFYQTQLLDLSKNNEPLDFEDIPLFGSLPELLHSLWQHLGLDVRFVRSGGSMPENIEETFTVGISGGQSPGQLVLLASRDIRKPKLLGKDRHRFLSALSQLLGDAYRWQQALRSYEEMQAVPMDISLLRHRSESLFQLLKDSAKLAECNAASLYLLEPKQKTLKLRACWGLPEERLLDPPKPLHSSLADVEAILGQAVIVNEDYLFETWRVPEDFPMAICLPVMSQQSIWGTLWLFANRRRDCTIHELNVMEYIAGRIAAELEKTALQKELAK